MSRRSRGVFPGASAYSDRHGRKRWRFRKKGFSAELGSDYGSPEFIQRYEDAVAGIRAKPCQVPEKRSRNPFPISLRGIIRPESFFSSSPVPRRLIAASWNGFAKSMGQKVQSGLSDNISKRSSQQSPILRQQATICEVCLRLLWIMQSISVGAKKIR